MAAPMSPKRLAQGQMSTSTHPILSGTMTPAAPSGVPASFSQYPSGGGKAVNFEDLGVSPNQDVIHNTTPAKLYEYALKYEKGTIITDTGAMAAFSGLKTGRSPKDKRVVEEASTKDDIWWGPVNFPLSDESFVMNRERAIDYLNIQDRIYVVDAYAGWDERYRLKVRIVCSRAYHALFMNNMLIRPTAEELENFGKPDFTIYNAGCFPCNRAVKGMSSSTSVALSFERNEMVILGSQYAGEMKKGILTVMMYLMPKRGLLTLHSSCNEADDGNCTLFFGLSGTGKTTLSADPKRALIGDDEHVWHDDGVFNIEGGCYAKCIGLTKEQEPEIYGAIKFGSVVENVVIDPDTRAIDYDDVSITENTRCAYPLEFIPNAKIPAKASHPNNVILLTCDAFGVLPPVSRLSPEQCMYQFISGYTAKVAGTEDGVTEPTPNFSACFGGPFLVWHPVKYAEMLAEKLRVTGAQAWLINSGWTGGKYGTGSRIKLKYTRKMVDAINNGTLAKGEFNVMPGTGLEIPKVVEGVPTEILSPWKTWSTEAEYKKTLNKLTHMFQLNFAKFSDKASPDLLKAEPKNWD
ncbi:Phosphoenolpyruvate carboxykinase [Diplonema papillatum]|nr:Phosphoenolpyruvate carboxykinase [Diplonema papillatum]